MHLPTGAMEMKFVDGEAAFLDDKSGLGSFLIEPRLELSLVLGARLHGEHQVKRRVADLDSCGASPRAREGHLYDPP